MRVLHVTECLVGGVRTAIEGYIKATPDIEHVALANSRRDENLTMGSLEGAAAFYPLPTGYVSATRRIGEVAREIHADVIHAHSSFAGLYARSPIHLAAPVVYTPHALAFGRPDFAAPKRALFRAAEWLLARRRQVLAGCSEHETDLLSRLGPSAAPMTIPNALPPDHPAHTTAWHAPQQPTVGMVGRINEYRNPEQFIRVTELVRQQRPDVIFTWIGDGDDARRTQLEAAGIHVTGWLSGEKLQHRISTLSAMLYTSTWDGFPMVILEAITAGVPTYVSDIAPLRECPASARFGSAAQGATLVLQQLDNGQPLSQAWAQVVDAHTFPRQRAALQRAYRRAVEAGI